MSFTWDTAQGLLYFSTLIVFGCASGLGLLILVGFPNDHRNRVLLAPVAITMMWALVGDLLVRSGLTMAQIALPLWMCSIVLALVAAWALLRDCGSFLDRATILLLLAVTGATVIGMAVPIARGLFRSLGAGNLDTFNYTMLAAAYWDHGMARHDLSPFFEQIGSFLDLGMFRNHTFVLLDFFSELVEEGEPAFVRNLFVCWTLFTIGAGAAYFHRVSARYAGKTALTLLYVWLVMGIGWAFVPSAVGNWDNALFVAIVPVLAGLSFEPASWRFAAALGVTAAYGFLTYPELAPVGGLIVAPYFVHRLFAGQQRARTMAHYAGAALVAFGLAAPALSHLWTYFLYQMRAAVTTSRPGGGFAGGLVLEWWNPAAWWALGPDLGVHAGIGIVGIATVLTAIALVGFARAARQPRHPLLWSLLGLVSLLAYFIGVERYEYAAYKILSVTWWLVALALLEGGVAVWHALERPRGRTLVRVGCAVLAVGVLATTSARAMTIRSQYFFPDWVERLLPNPDALMELRDRARRQPPGTVAIVGELARAPSLPWVLYALRSTPLRAYTVGGSGYVIEQGFIWNASGTPDTVLLTSTDPLPVGNVLLATTRYTLAEFASPFWVSKVANPNGMETWGYWLGTQPITIDVLVRQPTAVRLEFEAEPGPSRSESPDRTVIAMHAGREIARTQVKARQRVSLPITFAAAGMTQLTIGCSDAPTLSETSNRDARPQLVAIRGLSIRAAAATP